MAFETPILFLIFNRLDTTKLVFDRIRQIKPKYLYIAADGPRAEKEGEVIKTDEVRKFVIDNIDWQCDVKTLFRENNLGCKIAVSSAIDWFFDHVEMGIILEDDCYPSLSFFPFCESMLERYKTDNRIMQICGSNFHEVYQQGDSSYYYSNYGPIWGWATWRRFWELYDKDIKTWPMAKELELYKSICQNDLEAAHRMDLFDKIYNNEIDTWDFQVVYTRMLNNGLAIIPKNNLIKNIGFGLDATHTKVSDSRQFLNVYELEKPYLAPELVIRNHNADKLYLENFILPSSDLVTKPKINRIKKILRWLLN